MNIKLLSYNIQSWDMNDRRIGGVINLIKEHNPDIICLQEVTPSWFTILRKEFSDVYGFCGRDRYHGDKEIPTSRREKNNVLYRKDRFELIWSHTYWLGPDLFHQCKIEESTLNRVFTCVYLKDKITGKKFQQICTHLEFSNPISRKIQATILCDYLKTQTVPTLLAGDFNSEPVEKAYQLISEYMDDIGTQFNETRTTYHAYWKEPAKRIDFIFKNDNIEPVSFKIIEDQFEGLPPSDHFPLESEIFVK